MTETPGNYRWHFYFLLILLVNLSGGALNYFSFPETLFLAGFRFHIFTVLFLILAWFYGIPLVDTQLLKFFKWGLLWQFILNFIIIAAAVFVLFQFKLIKFADPDFLVELGASSLVDLPLYLVWLFPFFYVLYLWYSSILNLRGGKIIAVIIGWLPVSYAVLDYKTFSPVFIILAQLFIAGLFLTVAAGSRNFYFFYFWAYISFWIYLLTFGTGNLTLLTTLLAKRYDEWEGIFTVSGKVAQFKFFIYYAFCLLLMLINLLSNRKFFLRKEA